MMPSRKRGPRRPFPWGAASAVCLSPLAPPQENAEWRVVSIAPDYSVSEYGHVKRIVSVSPSGRAGRVLRPSTADDGYLYYSLRHDGRIRRIAAHRLVAMAFLGSRPSLTHQTAHNDGNTANCHFSNLRWATPKENSADKYTHGTLPTGERNVRAKLTEAQALEILRDNHTPHRQMAVKYGIARSHIHHIKSGANWAHLQKHRED